MPTGPAADTEQDLWEVAAPLDITMVDLALRTLAHHCRENGQPLPYVRAARLTPDQFELYLEEAAQLPTPWVGTTDASVWTLPNDVDDDELITDEQAGAIAAPYPSLVTIGHDLDGAHIFLDLEEAGALALNGSPGDTTEVITALALELATSQWADDLQVTVVGACADLEAALCTGRIRHLPDTGSVLADLARRAELDRDILTQLGAPDLHHARPEGTAPGISVPEIVLIAGDIDDDERAILDRSLQELPRVAVAAVTHGAPIGQWSLTLSEHDDTAVLEPIGLTLYPQRVDAQTYTHLIEQQLVAAQDTAPIPVVDEPRFNDSAPPPHPEPADLSHDELSGPDEHDQAEDVPLSDTAADEPVLAEPITDRLAVAAEDGHLNHGQGADDQAVEDQDRGPDRGMVERAELTEELTEDTNDDFTWSAVDDLTGPVLNVVKVSSGELGGIAATIPPLPAEATGWPSAAKPEATPPTPVVASPWVDPAEATIHQLHPAPRILVLGPVHIEHLPEGVEAVDKLVELITYIGLFPGGNHIAIDEAVAPGKQQTDNARNSRMTRARRMLGRDADGTDYLPRHTGPEGYRLNAAVTTDWQQWLNLLPNGPAGATTEDLEAALSLVRGRPFSGIKRRYFTWAERLMQEMISEVVDASWELGRRRLHEGRWQAAAAAAATGLDVEPGMERLARIQILAAHNGGNPDAARAAIERLLDVTDELGGDLEDATEQLIHELTELTTTGRRELVDAYAR